jgi:heme/copper-type cytochrome/quinol oxidase subunit 2
VASLYNETLGEGFEISATGTSNFDSYMLGDDELTERLRTLKRQEYRLLAVDNLLQVPANRSIRFIITSSDVLHS